MTNVFPSRKAATAIVAKICILVLLMLLLVVSENSLSLLGVCASQGSSWIGNANGHRFSRRTTGLTSPTTAGLQQISQRKQRTSPSKGRASKGTTESMVEGFHYAVQMISLKYPSLSTTVRGGDVDRRSRLYYRQMQERHQKDYRSHFVDVSDFQRDRRSRLWHVDLTDRRPGKLSWTSRLVTANVVGYGLQVLFPAVTQRGVKISEKILNGQELYRLVTPLFLHGGIGHLLSNMYSLNNVGPMVEKMFGPGRFLTTYILSGMAGNVLSSIQSPNPALGASGAVFGMIGSQFIFLNRNDWLLGRQGQLMTDSLAQTMGLNLLIGAMNPMVDNWGHLGGLAGGALVTYWFGPRLFLMDLPDGGRALVDKPMIRLPRSIESLPERLVGEFRRGARRLQRNHFVEGLEDKPWRKKSLLQEEEERRRRQLKRTNRSIKPKLY